MTRITSFGIKRKDLIPSAQRASEPDLHPAPAPVVTASAPTTGPDDEPVAKKRKVHRGTRGKKDKKNRKVIDGQSDPQESLAETGEPSERSTEPASIDSSSTSSAPLPKADTTPAAGASKPDAPKGRKTMAGLKGPKPGETIEEHAARMERKKARKDSRQSPAVSNPGFPEFDARRLASEKRRLDRIAEREANTTCFACRSQGHSAKDCPNNLDGAVEIDGIRTMVGRDTVNICYRCGSPQHTLGRCPRPVNKADPMPFASCFVCLGKGHLAGKCPQNQDKGVYPNGGKGCILCQGKDHLAKDCELRKDNRAIQTTLLPPSLDPSARSLGPDEDDFHTLNRKRKAVDLEEGIIAGRPVGSTPAHSAPARKPKAKVVAF
ncbi:E3 ubiquitin ligase interacting with arginine methyltransferase [Phaffia rhodozyma]|uniref:E3 ubiquitin ligase interacting with arginine methyltransferase n=1 Tax=Phaffia rhodozyma TaxID=264483 RepID=A0A0F7SRU5_PHARH|nr:E3 ubiquitin ligase interacting with arginine methyltransferase [Phaffia rhodozyma]